MKRATRLASLVLFVCALCGPLTQSGARAAVPVRMGIQHCVTEWSFYSEKAYADPFNEVELDILLIAPDKSEQRVPAFWAGDQNWRVRYAPHTTGRFLYRTAAATRIIAACMASKASWKSPPTRARIRSTATARCASRPISAISRTPMARPSSGWGTPGGWGFAERLKWPEDFQLLTADRVQKGFTVIQVVAGLYPDMPEFDPRGANEAGFPWDTEKKRINPAYFDAADLRIQYLVEKGLVPCIVGCWGYHLPMYGEPAMKKHWRNLVARWGAYPVIWCLAGEGSMPYYLSEHKDQDTALQKRGWTEIGRYVRAIDPFHHPVSIHPSSNARDALEDPSVLDYDMLQTGHGDRSEPAWHGPAGRRFACAHAQDAGGQCRGLLRRHPGGEP